MEEWDGCAQFQLEYQNKDTAMSCKPLFAQIVLWNVQFWITFYKFLEASRHLIDASARSTA